MIFFIQLNVSGAIGDSVSGWYSNFHYKTNKSKESFCLKIENFLKKQKELEKIWNFEKENYSFWKGIKYIKVTTFRTKYSELRISISIIEERYIFFFKKSYNVIDFNYSFFPDEVENEYETFTSFVNIFEDTLLNELELIKYDGEYTL